jgi:hypothetical protein
MRIRPGVQTIPMRLREEPDGEIAPIHTAERCDHSTTVCDSCLEQWANDYEIIDPDDVVIMESSDSADGGEYAGTGGEQ